MINRARVIFAVSLLFATTGCDGCKKDSAVTTAPSASATASAAPTPSAVDSAAVDPAVAAGKMGHCPNAVPGAKTEITDTKDGVQFKITGATPAITSDIRARAKVLLESATNQATEVKQHNGSGEGGGNGHCPIVMRNTTVAVTDVEGGSQIAVTGKDPKELDWLRRESRDRQHDIVDPGAQGGGQGKMAHCPSAVTGATTTVKDTKDGMEVAVTGKDAAAVQEIRDRGKSLLEAVKADAEGGGHKGDGSGGGGFGRCPVVVTDTTVTSKETPGGLTFTVKPVKAADLVGVRKEARDRAENFAATK